MSDALDTALNNLARKVKADVIATCAKVALIHVNEDNSAEYNRACSDIAAKLAELGRPSVLSPEVRR